jgi:hypothetical protein
MLEFEGGMRNDAEKEGMMTSVSTQPETVWRMVLRHASSNVHGFRM